MMKRTMGMVAALAAASVFAVGPADPEPFRKKAIACSWDLGNVTFADILSNKAAFAEMPFSGARLFAHGAKGPDGKRVDDYRPMNGAWPKGVLAPLLGDLRQVTEMRPFRHSFLGFSIAADRSHRLDFRDDAKWAMFCENVRQLTELARDGGCEGILVDPEDYGGGKQFYRIDGDPDIETALRLARKRGGELAHAIWDTFPKATLFSFWLWSSRRGYGDEPGGFPAAIRRHNDLWYAFLDGMLDGISAEGRMLDGDEYSYNYAPYNLSGFTYADCAGKNRACIAGVATENRMKFRGHVLIGSAMYLDRFTNPKGSFYYTGPLSGSRLLRFDENFSAALDAADEYVWFWAEKHAWIDWKIHGPFYGGGFTEHQTWDDCLPGIYDSILARLDPERFLKERFPKLRDRPGCTNLLAKTSLRVTGRNAYRSLQPPRVPGCPKPQRGERYVVAARARGEKPGIGSGFDGDHGHLWELNGVWDGGEGDLAYLFRIIPTIKKFSVTGSVGGTNADAVATFENFGLYRLPTEKEYPESGDWSVDIAGMRIWFTLDGGEKATDHDVLWGGGSLMKAKVSRDGRGRITLETSYDEPGHPDWAWTRRLTLDPGIGDEMPCEFFETRANRPGRDVTAKGVARRMPEMVIAPNLGKVKYGEPVDLLKDGFGGWESMGGATNCWVFENGVLENRGSGANIRTKRNDFTDFKLSFDVRVDKGCNSGVYLRGLYEIQVVDDHRTYGWGPSKQGMGAVYGWLAQGHRASKPAGEWQHVDVTLCDRHITVVLNGSRIIDNKAVRAFTGGALSTDVLAPGPIYIQGDHRGGAYRKVILTPIVKEPKK